MYTLTLGEETDGFWPYSIDGECGQVLAGTRKGNKADVKNYLERYLVKLTRMNAGEKTHRFVINSGMKTHAFQARP